MQFIRSKTFHWTAALAGLFAIFITVLFGFIYFKIDDYLISRSDRMITTQIGFFAGLPRDRLIGALYDHLRQDSRGVYFSGLFDAKGDRVAGNVAVLPDGLEISAPARSVPLVRGDDKAAGATWVRTVARRLDSGDTLVVGRNVDETREIFSVVGAALRSAVSRLLSLVAGRRLAQRACPQTGRGGQPAGPAHRRRRSA